MELKEFIENTIKDITGAINELKVKHINNIENLKIVPFENGRFSSVAFDIAVSVDDKAAVKGEAGMEVIKVLKGNISGDLEYKNSNVSRISFCIAINNDNE